MDRCDVYGWVNGEPVFNRDEFVFKARHRGAIEDDAELLAFAEKVTGHWYSSGWCRTFERFYLSDYALSEPRASLTLKEFNRLKELQQQARDAAKAADDAREWKLKKHGSIRGQQRRRNLDRQGRDRKAGNDSRPARRRLLIAETPARVAMNRVLFAKLNLTEEH